MNRWSEVETILLKEIRHRLSNEIANAGQYPEVCTTKSLSFLP
jgi:hypothetical protein